MCVGLEVDVLAGIELQALLALDLSTAYTAPAARVDVSVAAHLKRPLKSFSKSS